MFVEILNKIIEGSNNIVCICGADTASDCGCPDIWNENFAFYTERKYGVSPEDIYNIAYFETRREQFFKFYKDEMLVKKCKPNAVYYKLAQLEKEGKLKCTITKNIYNLPERAGCKNVINLYGTISDNICPKCKVRFSEDTLIASKNYPVCPRCKSSIKLGVNLVGEMMDNTKVTRAMEAVSRADVLLILDADLTDEEFGKYISCYQGDKLVVIRDKKEFGKIKANYFIPDKAVNVLPLIKNKDSNVVLFDKSDAAVND